MPISLKVGQRGNGGMNVDAVSPYIISADIKIPPPVAGRTKYPFAKMKVGDSFAVGSDELNRVRAASSAAGVRRTMKFAVRVDPISKTHRCWRIA